MSRTHAYTAGLLIQAAERGGKSEGVTIYTETAAKSLIVDERRVTGVQAEKADGTAVTLEAGHA